VAQSAIVGDVKARFNLRPRSQKFLFLTSGFPLQDIRVIFKKSFVKIKKVENFAIKSALFEGQARTRV
jgi:hypothetical protein